MGCGADILNPRDEIELAMLDLVGDPDTAEAVGEVVDLLGEALCLLVGLDYQEFKESEN